MLLIVLLRVIIARRLEAIIVTVFAFMLVFSLWLRELLSCVKKSDVLMVLISSPILRFST